jgi:hypothetical protein
MARSIYVVQSSAVPGREGEYNEWYDTVHLPGALAVPSVLSVERFRVTSRFGDCPHDYLAIYDLGDRPDDALRGLQAMRTTSPTTTAMAPIRCAIALTSIKALR